MTASEVARQVWQSQPFYRHCFELARTLEESLGGGNLNVEVVSSIDREGAFVQFFTQLFGTAELERRLQLAADSPLAAMIVSKAYGDFLGELEDSDARTQILGENEFDESAAWLEDCFARAIRELYPAAINELTYSEGETAFCLLLHLAPIEVVRDFASMEYLSLNNEPCIAFLLDRMQIFADLKNLSLRGSDLGDDDVVHLLTHVNQVENLDLSNTNVTAIAIDRLQSMHCLVSLNLKGTFVSDEAATSLTRLTKLEKLCLPKEQFSERGLRQVRGYLPNCVVSLS